MLCVTHLSKRPPLAPVRFETRAGCREAAMSSTWQVVDWSAGGPACKRPVGTTTEKTEHPLPSLPVLEAVEGFVSNETFASYQNLIDY